MRDYATLNHQSHLNRKRVTVIRDIDWWAEQFFKYLAKILYLIIFVLLAFSLFYFIRLGNSNRIFPLQNIVLTGDHQITSTNDIKNALADLKQKSFFNTDLDDISEKLEALPWIKQAYVVRQWPSGLSINIVERVPMFRWGDDQLLDADGVAFKNIGHTFANLPAISGPEGSQKEVIKHYLLYNQLFEHGSDLAMSKFILNQYLSWEVHLKDKTIIKLGREDFDARVKRLAKAYRNNKVPSLSNIDIIDLRYNQGFAIKWKKDELTRPAKDKNLINVSQTQI